VVDRTVKVSYKVAYEEFVEGNRKAAKSVRDVGTEGEKLAQTREALNTLGTAGVAAGGLLAAGVGVAIAKFAEFDQAMANVLATGKDARDNQVALRDAAMDAGASTVFSATESANAIEEMAKAGIDAKDILGGGLAGALDLAAAGGLGVADAAGIAATALKTFKLEGSDMTHVADLLAAGAGKAMGDVSDLSQALAQGGQAAALTGLSIEETTASLAAFASQGLLGSDAGTSLKTMLLSLNPTTEKAATLMDELNLRAFDQQGQFIGVAAYAGKLQAALGDMSAEQQSTTLKTIFGTDAYRAAAVMLDEGEAGMREWISAVDDSGYAQEVAAQRLNNLIGDWEAFTGALDTAFISMGEGANGPLRFLVQTLTEMVDGFNELPSWVQQGTLAVAGLFAAVGLLGGGLLLAIPKIAEFRVAMDTLNVSRGRVASGLGSFVRFLGGPWGLAMIAATASAAAFNSAIEAGVPSQAQITNSVNKTASAMDMLRAASERGTFEKNVFGDYQKQFENLPGLLDRATEAGWRWAELSFNEKGALDSLKRLGDSLGEMASTNLPAAQNAFSKLVDEFALTDAQASQLLDEMPALRDELLRQASAAGVVADDQTLLKMALGETSAASEQSAGTAQSAAGAYLEAADGASALEDELSSLIDKIMEANGVGQDAVSANIDYQDALAKVDETIQKAKDGVEGYALSLDQGTQVGRDNLSMLNDLAASSQNAADKQFALDGNTQNYRSSLESGRQALIDRAMDLGYNADQASALADQIYRIPTSREVEVIAKTQAAAQRAQEFANLWESIKNRTVTLTMIGQTQIGGGSSPAVGPLLGGYGFGSADGNLVDYHRGMVQAFSSGGFATGIYAAQPNSIHKFAEPETGWEAYISGKPSERERNIKIWEATGARLGAAQGATYVTNNTTTQVDVHVQPLPGMSEAEVARMAAEKFDFALRSR
jgi:TP901 family phage tail tape measure protein